MKLLMFLIFLSVQNWSSAREIFRAHFIKSYVVNEKKPTYVIFFDLCWSAYEKVLVANQVSNQGGRVALSLKTNLENEEDHLLFLLDLDCSNSNQLLKLASSMRLFSKPHRWLVLTNSTEDSKLETLWNSPVLADSDLVLAERKEAQYVMMELHKPAINHTMLVTPRGFYNGTFSDTRPRREHFWRRMDLMGHPITMANVIQNSNSTKDHLEDGLEFKYDGVTKISWLNAKVAIQMLNATPRYIFSYRWGYKINGQWSGMVRDLESGNADMGTNCLMNIERFSIITYTDTIAPFDVRFVFRQPPLSYVANIYSLPFSTKLWVGVGVCSVVSAVAISIAARWETRHGRSSSQLGGGVSDAMFWTMCAVSQQGCDMEPRRTPGRIMEFVVFTSLMALFAAYSANIVVLLQAPSNSIRTLSQLTVSKVTLAAIDLDYSRFIFKQFKDPVHVAVSNKILPEKGKPQFHSLNEGVEQIRQGLFAFHSITEQVYRRIEETFTENEKCDLAEIDCLNSFQPYTPMRKTSPYIDLVRVVFKRIRETGVYSALNRRYQVPKPECAHKGAAFNSVGLRDLKPVLLLMVIGFGASIVILLVEIGVFYLSQKMKKRGTKQNINQPQFFF